MWLGAAVTLMQAATYDLKALGARLLLVLLHRVRSERLGYGVCSLGYKV